MEDWLRFADSAEGPGVRWLPVGFERFHFA